MSRAKRELERDDECGFLQELLIAADRGDEEKVAELIQQGVDVNSRAVLFGNTPLYCAVSGGHVAVAALLLKAGAQVDSRGPSEDTPLHKAASGGHVGVAELLLKAGAQVDIRDERGKTPEDIAASTDVPSWYGDEDRVLKGRKEILELFAAEKPGRLYRSKVGSKGGDLKTQFCAVSVSGGAVTMETEITCQVINPNDVTLPLKDGEMLVSDIIELGPHGTTFHQPVTVQLQYNSTSSGGATEAVVWVTEDRSHWTELEITKETKDMLSVSVDHFSIFAVISQPKHDQFPVPTEGRTLTSSTQPAVQISFPEQAATTETQVTIQVQEVPKSAVEDIKAKNESVQNLVGTSPIVNVQTVSTSAVQFHKPVTVRVPHPQHYMDIQHEGPTKLRVMSCEEGTEDWMDVTDNVTISRVTEEFVEFEVTHFTRWIVVLVEDILGNTEKFGPIPTIVCQWLQRRPVQFILLQREDNANEVIVECTLDGCAEEKRPKLMKEGYKAQLPSGTEHLYEGQQVNIRFQGNVKLTRYGARGAKQQITFHSQQYNRIHMHLMALKDRENSGLDGQGYVELRALPRVEVAKQKVKSQMATMERSAREAEERESRSQHSFASCQFVCHMGVQNRLLAVHTVELSKEAVSTDWQDLAFHLGFERADIANIAGRNRDDKSRCMDMLQEWKKKKGDAATIEVLMEALSEAGLQSVVDELKKYPQQVANYGLSPPAKGLEETSPREGRCRIS
ncbi:positive regulation of extrinsic apoptotic signaling pathway via death domain receptors protein [Branchiostoma belcheri]|nr:positive regulation of extrinsic apoptotic signaling pathway via death domain receptors protein [Branchiostoma belcheri]